MRTAIVASLAGAAALLAAAGASAEPVRIVYATDWKAQAEHGGLYQAVATGLYEKYGLEVEIKMGGPQINTMQLVGAGAVDMATGSNSFFPLNLLQAGAQVPAVMAMFQKDPQFLMVHPDQPINSIADMKGKPILLANDSLSTFWVWLQARYGFTDDQVRPYTFSMAPWLADPTAIQQGYITSEPFAVEREGGFKPKEFLLADEGYPAYSSMAIAPQALIESNPDAVQGFVNATIEGWYSYVYGDPAPANALIKAANPDMDDDQIAFGIAKLKEYGIVDSGDALTLGIGAMTDARWKEFFDLMVQNGVYPADLDVTQAYTLAFVNQGHGMDMKPKE